MFCDEANRLWVMDTGSGNDLVPESAVCRDTSEIVKNRSGKKLHTANGIIDAPDRVKFNLPELNGDRCKALILPSTPFVLSMGYRCVAKGYDFIWRGSKGEKPYMIDDKGVRHDLELHGYVPYLRTAEPAMPNTDLDSDVGDGS